MYTLDIGQNDLHGGFWSITEKQVLASIPKIINQFAQAVEVTKIMFYIAFQQLIPFFQGENRVVFCNFFYHLDDPNASCILYGGGACYEVNS